MSALLDVIHDGVLNSDNSVVLPDGISKIEIKLKPNTFIEQVKLLSNTAMVPMRATTVSACKDLFSPIDCIIPAGKNLLIKTDIAIAWNDPNYYMQLLSRSGLAYKNNIVVQAGVIDIDYRQNIGVLLQNNSDVDFEVKRGDRIAQYTYVKIMNQEESELVDEFFIDIISNREGGFGSTGR